MKIFPFPRHRPMEREVTAISVDANTGEQPVLVVNTDQTGSVTRWAIRAMQRRMCLLAPALQELAEQVRRWFPGSPLATAAGAAIAATAGSGLMMYEPEAPREPRPVTRLARELAPLERVARPGASAGRLGPPAAPQRIVAISPVSRRPAPQETTGRTPRPAASAASSSRTPDPLPVPAPRPESLPMSKPVPTPTPTPSQDRERAEECATPPPSTTEPTSAPMVSMSAENSAEPQ